MKLSTRETATILAALRLFQKTFVDFENARSIAARAAFPHFTECDALDDEEIDALCMKLNKP